MIFEAGLAYQVPGNFITWSIVPIEGHTKKVKIPDDYYSITGIHLVLEQINIRVEIPKNFFEMPRVLGAENLKNAVFEFEKTGIRTFKILRHIGELEQTTTIKPAGQGGN